MVNDAAPGPLRDSGSDIAELLGVAVPSWQPGWAHPAMPVRGLPAPVAVAADGSVVSVDIMAAPLGGDGPHGVVLGGSGAGKTETLLTFALSLCATYSPAALRIAVLSGSNTQGHNDLSVLAGLPHVEVLCAGEPDAGLRLDTAEDWIRGESRRRRRELRTVHPARRPAQGPHLLVIVDDYQLLDGSGDADRWLSLLWRVVSGGAALNMHLLIASDVVSTGVRMLLPHFGFRVALGTHDVDAPADFSGAAIEPGAALLAVGDADPVACRFAHPSGEGGRVRDRLIERISAAY